MIFKNRAQKIYNIWNKEKVRKRAFVSGGQ
jgi:hypothetical protein